jgi:hypothetical protein
MSAPQIIMVGLVASELTIFAVKHGEYRGKYNFWVTLVSDVLLVALLWWGGFWS